MFGKIVKITPAKKLMVKIDEQTYERIHSRVTDMCTRKNFPQKAPLFILQDDNGDDAHFAFITLDKYDRNLVSTKFEKLIKKDVKIGFTLAPYDFVGDDGEDVKGVNLVLQTIHQDRQERRKTAFSTAVSEKKIPVDFMASIEPELKELEKLAEKERENPIQQFIKHQEQLDVEPKIVRRRKLSPVAIELLKQNLEEARSDSSTE